jgi:hypothetical protein
MMQCKFIMLAATAIYLVALPTQAFACKFVAPTTEGERTAAANATVSGASVIMEAEVARPSKLGGKPALLKALTVVKGPKSKKFFSVTGNTSCDNLFTEIGSRHRVLLFGGPKLYRASKYVSSPDEIDRAIAAMQRRKR